MKTNKSRYANFSNWLNVAYIKLNGMQLNGEEVNRLCFALERLDNESLFFPTAKLSIGEIKILAFYNHCDLIEQCPANYLQTIGKYTSKEKGILLRALKLLLQYKQCAENLYIAKKRSPYKWTRSAILAEAMKYQSLSDFSSGNQSAYKASHRDMELIEEIRVHYLLKKREAIFIN